ncbi:MAG TPA: hypothetical protein VMH81_39515 [Bryobacteraceae bacterium]|nr:hypothetical protein [Bryobacteraceae bacterium]
MKKSNYWPLDYDPEGEIYDSLAWDLPGFRREGRDPRRPRQRTKPVPSSRKRS